MENFKKYYLVFAVAVIAFFLGAQFGPAVIAMPGEGDALEFVDANRDLAPAGVDWRLLWDAIDQIKEKYVDRPPDMLELLYGAVSGAVASLGDPYSVFLPPKQAENFKNELAGNLEGIGAEIALRNLQLVVVSPLDDSPAQKAGIKPGDFIYKVDGTETLDMTLEEAVGKIRGPAGSEVTLTVFHKGESDPVDITITRAQIVVKSVSSEILEANGKKVGHLKLRRFGENTQAQIESVISEYLLQNVQGIILDVRNNPGGFLDTAIAVAGNWIKRDEIVMIQQFGDGSQEIFKSEGTARLGGIPTVVLQNGGSASASEIVAGALKDHGLAQLVGEKSFGKGSVQELVDLREKAQVKLTIAKWLTPAGHDLNKEGLDPDIEVELTEEDFQNDVDPQLDRALEILAGAS